MCLRFSLFLKLILISCFIKIEIFLSISMSPLVPFGNTMYPSLFRYILISVPDNIAILSSLLYLMGSTPQVGLPLSE
jgi:hypothetical protein